MQLKTGDLVMLKSGGHSMTVAEVKDDEVTCIWMGIEGNLYRESLPAAVLDRSEEEDDLIEEEED